MEPNQIERFKISHLRNMEYTLIVPRIVAIVENHNPDALRLRKRLDAVKFFMPELSKIEAYEHKWHASLQKNELEHYRDNLLAILIHTERNYARLSLPVYAAASTLLTGLLDKHKRDMASDNETSETQRIYNLIGDIERTPGMLDALTSFALVPIYEELKKVNTEFENLWRQRNKELSEKDRVNVKAIRSDCDKAFKTLLDAIEYCYTEYGDTEYVALIKELSKLGAYYKQQLKARSTRRKNGIKHTEEELIKPA